MKKPQRRGIVKNVELRNSLIAKGIITPAFMVPQRLAERGFTEAAKAAAERFQRGKLYGRP